MTKEMSHEDNHKSDVTQYEMAVRFQQKSAEIYALQIQAFNSAKIFLLQFVKNNQETKPPAIVIDLDETVLNNMPFVAMGIEKGFDYTKWGDPWDEWVEAACAEAIPGAKEFLELADDHQVKIFYVSNRLDKDKTATIKNMKELGLPQVDEESVLLWGKKGKKKDRRAFIRKNYNVIMLIGNSLYDLSSIFKNKSTKEQIKLVAENAEKFGTKFILLPNSSYGDYWTDAKLDPWEV